MERLKMKMMKQLPSRKPKVEDDHREKPRKLQQRKRMEKVGMRKNFHQRRRKKVKGEVGLLERKPKKRKMPKTRMRRKQLRRRRQVERRRQCTRRTVKKVGLELIRSLKLLRT